VSKSHCTSEIEHGRNNNHNFNYTIVTLACSNVCNGSLTKC